MVSANDDVGDVKKIMKGIGVGLFVILLLVAVFGSFYMIESGQEGVLLTFGRANEVAQQPGLHLKVPIVQDVVKFDMRTQKYGISALSAGDSSGNPATGGSLESASSSDLQIVSLQVVVNYHLATGQSPKVFIEVGPGYEDTVIQPAVHEATKAAVAQFTAAELIDKREEVRAKIEDLLKSKLIAYNIIVEQVSIVNLDFSAQFNQAIESKVTQEQNALAANNTLQKIRIEAEQVRVAAAGQRDATIAQATGDAEKVRLIQEQLSQSPQYIEYIKWSKWSGQWPSTYVAGQAGLLFQMPSGVPSTVQMNAQGNVSA